MAASRLFLSQAVLDRWLSEGLATLDGETLASGPDRLGFELKTGLLFESEPTESGDSAGLLGKVKDLDQVLGLGGDYSTGTVILGDAAYEVVEGFVGTAVPSVLAVLSSKPPPRLSGALPPRDAGVTPTPDTASAAPDPARDSRASELGLLARFFLQPP